MADLIPPWSAAGCDGTDLPQRSASEELAEVPIADLALGGEEMPDQGVWILPAARAPSGRTLRVLLSRWARDHLEALPH